MLSVKFLEDLETYIRSGRLEDDYKYSAEDRKLEILDYLERLMDLAEDADTVATRLLMPNLATMLPTKTPQE